MGSILRGGPKDCQRFKPAGHVLISLRVEPVQGSSFSLPASKIETKAIYDQVCDGRNDEVSTTCVSGWIRISTETVECPTHPLTQVVLTA